MDRTIVVASGGDDLKSKVIYIFKNIYLVADSIAFFWNLRMWNDCSLNYLKRQNWSVKNSKQ